VLRSLQTAEKAMHFEQTRIDYLANNLANVDSSGFKQVLSRVSEAKATKPDPTQPAAAPNAAAPTTAAPQVTGLGLWPQQRELYMYAGVDLRQGDLEPTGRGTDIALQGDGFFVVQDAGGNEFYTRSGSFGLDEQHRLVTAQGYLVQGSGGEVVLDGDGFGIGGDGTVTVDGGSPGRLRVVTFADPQRLEHRGDGMMTAPADMPATDLPENTTVVAQGFLERSNVDPVQTLVAMIEAQRSFEIASKVLQTNDELLGRSTNTLGRNS
jgi:flagellar basal-body rod protein FlgF